MESSYVAKQNEVLFIAGRLENMEQVSNNQEKNKPKSNQNGKSTPPKKNPTRLFSDFFGSYGLQLTAEAERKERCGNGSKFSPVRSCYYEGGG